VTTTPVRALLAERSAPVDVSRDLLDRSLAAAEAVIEARAALYRGLMDRGWTAPPVVTEALRTDLAVLHLPGV
jgi:hypothetical protein